MRKSVTRYWGKCITIWYEQEQGSVLTQACVEWAGIWWSAHRLLFYYHLQSSKTKFHISCCDTESNSKLKFIFHVAAISGLTLSSRAEIPKPSLKDGPDKRGSFLQWKKKYIILLWKLFIHFICLFIYWILAFCVYVWGKMLYCKSLSEIWHYVPLLSVVGFVVLMDSCIHSLMSHRCSDGLTAKSNWLFLSHTHTVSWLKLNALCRVISQSLTA